MKIALAGNPNSGKTTLYNNLTGSNQYVGNWPGVTVEKKEGSLKKYPDIFLTDLPGIYSLSPYTPEEVTARNYLINSRPDAILNIVDGTNLERNLYLTLQLCELGIPVVTAVNMMDTVRKNGDSININRLMKKSGIMMFEISALKGEGTEEAITGAVNAAKSGKAGYIHTYSDTVEHALNEIITFAVGIPTDRKRWYAIKVFERDEKILSELNLSKRTVSFIEQIIKTVEVKYGDDSEAIIADERYTYITRLLNDCYKRKNSKELSATDKIDRIVTHRIMALPIFAVIMFLVYFVSVTAVGAYIGDFIESSVFGKGFFLFGEKSGIFIPGARDVVLSVLNIFNCPTQLSVVLADITVDGVGTVLGFLPQLFVLFILLAILETCGYMSRIAFILDRIFRKFGLSGKSFIPMLIGTGCGVPGIMASRTIENECERRMTVITTTFIPCSAKLPMIALISSAMFNGAWWVAPSAYLIGIAAVLLSGILLRKSKILNSSPSLFIMELPAYRLPGISGILNSAWQRVWQFIKKAGTLILISSVIIKAGSIHGYNGTGLYFNLNMPLEQSVLGYIGKVLKWIFVPLGFGSIKASIATVMGLLAKEEIVGVFGLLDFENMSKLSAYSFMLFNLLCAPCVAAVGAIGKEMKSPKWTWFAISYQTVFAYTVSFTVYQIGSAFSGSMNIFCFNMAVLIVFFVIYLLLKKKSGISHKNCRFCEYGKMCR